MKKMLFVLATLAGFTASTALAQTSAVEEWTDNYLSATHNLSAGTSNKVVAVDTAGNLFVGMDAGKLGAPFDGDLVLMKYGCGGALQWAVSFDYLGGNRWDHLSAIDTDGAGNLYVAASGQTATTTLWVILKYDPNGNLVWQQTYGGPNRSMPVGLVVDKAGYIAVAGNVWDAINSTYRIHGVKFDAYTSLPGLAGSTPLIGTWSYAKAMTVDALGNLLVIGDASLTSGQNCLTVRFPGSLATPNVLAPTFKPYAPSGGSASGQAIACNASGSRVFALANTWAGSSKIGVLCYKNLNLLPAEPAWNGGLPFLKPNYGSYDDPRAIAVAPSGRVVTLSSTWTTYSDLLISQWAPNGLTYLETDSSLVPAFYDDIRPGGLKLDALGRIYVIGTGRNFMFTAVDFVTEAFAPLTVAGQLPDWFDFYDSWPLGSLDDEARAITLDVARNVYVAGESRVSTTVYATAVKIGQGAPANDTCGTSMPVTAGTTAFTTYFANDTAPAVSPCGGDRKDVWFKWTAPCPGNVDMDTFGSCFDTVLSVFKGSCGALVPVACNNDATAGRPIGSRQSFVTFFNATAGTTYFIQVGGGGAPAEEGTGRLTIIGPTPPLNTCPPGAVWSAYRKFRIFGTGNTSGGGLWRITVPCCTDYVGLAPTALGDSAIALAAKLRASINAACPGFNAVNVGNQVWVRTKCGNAQRFVFRVGSAGTPPDQLCIVPDINPAGPFYTSPLLSCTYNPTVYEEPYEDVDANRNDLPDELDIAQGTSLDVNQNGIPDETEVSAAPPLSIRLAGSNVVVSWSATGFLLQTAPKLSAEAAWEDVPNATNSPVTLPLGPGMQFFRLRSE